VERTHEKQRKHYTPEEKVGILRRHLLEQMPISKLCDELGLQPTVFYRWQKEFFENGRAAFEQKARPNHRASEGSGEHLLQHRNKSIHLTQHVPLVSQEDVVTHVWHTDDVRARHALFKGLRYPLLRRLR